MGFFLARPIKIHNPQIYQRPEIPGRPNATRARQCQRKKGAMAQQAERNKRRNITRSKHPRAQHSAGESLAWGNKETKRRKHHSGPRSGFLSPKLGIGQRSASGREGAPSTSQEKKEGEATPEPLKLLRNVTPSEAGAPKRLKRGWDIHSGNREGGFQRRHREMRGERAWGERTCNLTDE